MDDAFDQRVRMLNSSHSAPRGEVDAAVRIYERLVTARAACESGFGATPPVEAVLATFDALCRELQSGQGSNVEE